MSVELVIDWEDRKELGRTGERVPAIGIGTWDIRDYAKAEDALTRAIEEGLNLIDTAEMYDSGKAEELVGRVVARVGRDNVFIVTKLLPERFTSPEMVLRATRASLSRLGVSSVDLLLIHWPHPVLPIEIQVRNLERAAEAGLARYIGVSNFDEKELELALSSTRKHDIVVDQVKYSVLDKSVERRLLPLCVEAGVTLQAYTPLERGLVVEIEELKRVGSKYGKTAAQVALNYLISHKRVIAIPKSEKARRIDEFRGALGWRLSREDLELLRAL
ncbi:MAG: aldo/keto reductase [Fervidicoccaceae archaeon]